MTNEIVTHVEAPKVMGSTMATTPRHQARLDKLAREEKELEELIKAQNSRSNGVSENAPEADQTQESNDEDGYQSSELEVGNTEGNESQQADNTEEQTEQVSESTEGKTKEVDWEKRYKDLQRAFTKSQQDLKKVKETVEKASDKTAKRVSEEDVKAWINKYPNIASIVEQIAEQKARSVNPELSKLVEMRENLLLEKMEAKVASVHPDFEEVRASEKFTKWLEKKPQWVKDTLYDNLEDADSVIEVISMFKASNPTTKEPSNRDAARRVSKSTASSSTSPTVRSNDYLFSESQIERMSIKEYEKREDEIMKARATGRIRMDISGGAR